MKSQDAFVRITVLSENTGCETCEGEHGLSLYIERNTDHILLDAGQSDLFYENAGKLGIDIGGVNYAILSHSHYDHADGFETFFKVNKDANLYVRKGTGEYFYSKHSELKYIGPKKGMLEANKNRIIYVDEKYYSIGDGDMFLVPHSTRGLSAIGEKSNLYKMEGERLVPDDFAHEQSFVINTSKGLVIFNSCSHGGPANVIHEVLQQENRYPVYAYIGGFHLSKYPDEDVLAFAETLKDLQVERIITGHCTGDRACHILKEQLGDKVEQMHAGMVIEM